MLLYIKKIISFQCLLFYCVRTNLYLLVHEGKDVCDHVLLGLHVVEFLPIMSYPGKHPMSAVNPTANPFGGGFVMSLYGTCKLGAGH